MLYPWFSQYAPKLSIDVHPVTVTKVASLTNTQTAFAFGGLGASASNSAVNVISQ